MALQHRKDGARTNARIPETIKYRRHEGAKARKRAFVNSGFFPVERAKHSGYAMFYGLQR